MSVDPRAATGFAAGAAYERGRPSYPPDLVARIARQAGLTPATAVLDLAAGTGKLTRVLVPLVGRVVAVDPSEPMLGELRRQLPGVDALAGHAEAIPLPDDSVDAVFVGEAFHWFRTRQAAAEIARVLTPSGALVLVWNRARWGEQQHAWWPAFDALVRPHRESAGPFPAGDHWREALEESLLFGPVSTAEAEHDHRIGVDDFVALVSSWSWIANLPDRERGELLRRVRELVGGQGALTLRYRTEVHSARLATAGPA